MIIRDNSCRQLVVEINLHVTSSLLLCNDVINLQNRRFYPVLLVINDALVKLGELKVTNTHSRNIFAVCRTLWKRRQVKDRSSLSLVRFVTEL